MSVCGLAGQKYRDFIIIIIILGQYMCVDAKWCEAAMMKLICC